MTIADQKEKQLKQRIAFLGERLAMSLAYLIAIENTVDPFSDREVDKAWIVATLTNRAKADVYRDREYQEPSSRYVLDVVRSARNGTKLNIKDTGLYQDCLTSVRKLLQNGKA